MNQLVQPNFSATGSVGYCLAYAEDFFRAPHVEPTARSAWDACKFKHEDMSFPDAIVPIWFSYIENGVDYGHVAAWVPGKGIYSSPWQSGTNHAVLPSISELIRIYSDSGTNPMAFLGWSEDISTLRVVQGGVMPSASDVQNYIKTYTGADATPAQVSFYTVRPWQELSTDVCDFLLKNVKSAGTDFVPVSELFIKK